MRSGRTSLARPVPDDAAGAQEREFVRHRTKCARAAPRSSPELHDVLDVALALALMTALLRGHQGRGREVQPVKFFETLRDGSSSDRRSGSGSWIVPPSVESWTRPLGSSASASRRSSGGAGRRPRRASGCSWTRCNSWRRSSRAGEGDGARGRVPATKIEDLGPVAQLGARLNGIQKVTGSIPVVHSTSAGQGQGVRPSSLLLDERREPLEEQRAVPLGVNSRSTARRPAIPRRRAGRSASTSRWIASARRSGGRAAPRGDRSSRRARARGSRTRASRRRGHPVANVASMSATIPSIIPSSEDDARVHEDVRGREELAHLVLRLRPQELDLRERARRDLPRERGALRAVADEETPEANAPLAQRRARVHEVALPLVVPQPRDAGDDRGALPRQVRPWLEARRVDTASDDGGSAPPPRRTGRAAARG